MGKEKNSWAMFLIIALASVYSAFVTTDRALLILFLAYMMEYSETLKLILLSFPQSAHITRLGLLITMALVFYFTYKKLALRIVCFMRRKHIS